MEIKTPGRHKSVESFKTQWAEVAPDLGCDDSVSGRAGPFAQPYDLGDISIGNRWAIHPMEGWDGTGEGLPTADTLRRWRRFGESGAKLIWGGEAFAVCPEGRANPNQLFLNPHAETEAGLASLRQSLIAGHESLGEGTSGLFIGLQLTHSGRFSRPTAEGPAPLIACHHPVLDPRQGIDSDGAILSDLELEGIAEHYLKAARMAVEQGFDFIDLKCCHGYLMHELLGAKTRPGPYGGSFENRTRLFARILREIRLQCPSLEVGVRVSIGDLIPFAPGGDGPGEPATWERGRPYLHGFGVDERDPRHIDLGEGLRFLGFLRDQGIRLVNLSLGSPYYCPHLQRPAAYPPSDGYRPFEDPLNQVATHLRCVRRCKEAYPQLAFVGTGYSYLQEWLPHVGQHELAGGHVDFVGIGRMVLSYPQMPHDVLTGRELKRKLICRTFSDCTTAPRKGMRSGCYPLDEHYRSLPEARRLRGRKEPRS